MRLYDIKNNVIRDGDMIYVDLEKIAYITGDDYGEGTVLCYTQYLDDSLVLHRDDGSGYYEIPLEGTTISGVELVNGFVDEDTKIMEF
jgi:hypothetical protein